MYLCYIIFVCLCKSVVELFTFLIDSFNLRKKRCECSCLNFVKAFACLPYLGFRRRASICAVLRLLLDELCACAERAPCCLHGKQGVACLALELLAVFASAEEESAADSVREACKARSKLACVAREVDLLKAAEELGGVDRAVHGEPCELDCKVDQ